MLDNLATKLLAPVNTSVISIMGVFNILLGFWLLMPFNSFSARFTINGLELTIAILTLSIGGLILYGSLKEKLYILGKGALAGFIFWLVVTGLALFVNWQSAAWIFTIMIATYHGFVGVNIKVNSKNLPNKT